MRTSTAARALLLTALPAAVLAGRAWSVPAPGPPRGADRASTRPAAGTLQESGRILAEALGCGGCHTGLPDPASARGRAPLLGPTATEALPADFVFAYLGDPVRRREDIGPTRMPDFRFDEAERVALAGFLGSGEPGPDLRAARRRHPEADARLGRGIFGALGCAACHAGVDGAPSGVGPDLSREGARVRPEWLRAYLGDPRPVRRDGHPGAPGARMPDFRLSAGEADALAGYLGGLGSRFARLEAEPLTHFQALRTGRLLEERLACLGCHRLGGRGGTIGPSLDGLAQRLQPDFVVEMILDPRRAVPGSPMPRQPLPEREAARLARYLLAAGGAPEPAPRASLAEPDHPVWAASVETDRGPGDALYGRHCAACHGPTGRGDGWNAPNLPVPPTAHADAGLMEGRVDDALFDGIHGGARVLDGSPRMPPFGSLLGTGEIRALVATIRRLCDCSGPAWASDGHGDGR